MSTLDQINYLNKKYIEDNILDRNLNKINDSWFMPYIYTDEGYIPICQQCYLDFENFKSLPIQEDMTVEMKHPRSCLWTDYFINKIKNICITAQIRRKRK